MLTHFTDEYSMKKSLEITDVGNGESTKYVKPEILLLENKKEKRGERRRKEKEEINTYVYHI